MFFENYTNAALKIISTKLKKKYITVIILNLLNVFLDILGLISIYPLASSIIGKENSKIDIIIDNFILKLNLDINNKIFYIFYFFILTIIIKNILLIYIKFTTADVIEKIFQEVSLKMNKKILFKNFLFFSNFQQPVLIKNLREIPIEFKNYLDVYLNYYVSILNLIIITLTLVFFNYKITLFVLIYIFSTTMIFKFLFSRKAKIWGAKGNIWAGKIYTQIIDTINLIHEIKLRDKINFFLEKHSTLINEWSNLILRSKFISSITRPIFEIFLILPLAILVIVFNKNILNSSILPMFCVYIYAAFRTLPSLVNLNIAELKKKNYLFAIDYLINLFNQKENKISDNKNYKSLKFKSKINLKNISYKYLSSQEFIFKNLNFEIIKNDFIGIKGHSGVGKSTLIKIILGLLEPNEGKIIIDENYEFNEVKTDYKKMMSYVPQNLFLLNDSVKNNIAFATPPEYINDEQIWNVLKLSSADNFVKKLDGQLDFEIKNNGQNLSGGQAQRIAIARSLYNNPDIIIMDEATNSLDNLTEQSFINDLSKLKGKVTIIFISHKITSLNFCDKIFEVNSDGIKKIS